MQWYFDSNETDEFEQTIEMRLRRAEAWAETRGSGFDPDTAREALRFRHDSRDGRLGYWTPALVREFLLETVPERFTGSIEHYAHVPESLRTWLRFLEHAAALHPHGSNLPELEQAVDECAEPFPAAFADPGNWGPARIAAQAALASGIDLATPSGVERFNAFMKSGSVDQDAVAAAVARQAARRARTQRVPALPATGLPSPERSAALAADAEAVHRTVAFLDWLGDGRALTQRGNLRKADAIALVELLGTGDDIESFTSSSELPGLNWYMELVVGTGLVRRVKQRLVPVAERTGLTRDPFALLLAAWDTAAIWRLQRPGAFAERHLGDSEPVLRLLVEALLGTGGDADLPVAEIRSRIGSAVYGDGDDPDDIRGLVASFTLHRSINHMLAALRRFGAAEFDRAWDPDEELGMGGETTEVSVKLTELGRALLWTRWRGEGLVAPMVGELTGYPAAVMLGTVVDHYGQESGVEEVRRWLSAHGDDQGLLLEAIAANPFRTSQNAMLGAAADAAGPALLDQARSSHRLGSIALLLLSIRGHIDLTAMIDGTEREREETLLGLTEEILELVELLGPEGYAESVSDLPQVERTGMVAMIPDSAHPDQWLVDLFSQEVAPLIGTPGPRRRESLAAARNRTKRVKRKKRSKRRRR